MMDKMAEHILCFRSELLQELGPFQGLSTEVDRYFPALVMPPNSAYVVRREAEEDLSIKQIIPYVLFVYEDRILSYRRGKHGSEGRLRELHSVGIGGHIAAEDTTLFNRSHDPGGYYKAMRREVFEEVRLDCADTEAPCVALINDDSNDVGRVHFGVVHLIRLSTPEVSKKESFITQAGLVDIRKAVSGVKRYETWSQLRLEHFNLLIEKSTQSMSRSVD